MATNKPTKITISGRLLNDQYFGQHGDIYVYWRDNQKGTFARQGGHANFGYPGYFLASIFDGGAWRKLQFNKLVAYEDRSYDLAQDRQRVLAYLAQIIALWCGAIATYNSDTRSFTIPGKEIA